MESHASPTSSTQHPARKTTMIDKETKKRLKKIQKDIRRVKKEISKAELRPCQNDADLKKKEEEIAGLGDKLRAFEKEQDRYILDSGRVRHST
jgi:septal ring factor EnvC (AmiA/AmiB activator)